MKKLTSLLLVLAMLLSLAACTQTAKPEETTPAATEAAVPATEETVPETTVVLSHYPITVTDHAGREVVIEEEPERLVSGYYISTSLLIALDLDEKMVGIEAKANKRAIYSLSAPELIALPSVGTAKEFDLVELMMRNPGRVYSRDNLLNIVWGYEYPGDARTVDVHIRRLREKIETNPSDPKYVYTKWGVGYYFKG